jgi:hypothetical protein
VHTDWGALRGYERLEDDCEAELQHKHCGPQFPQVLRGYADLVSYSKVAQMSESEKALLR